MPTRSIRALAAIAVLATVAAACSSPEGPAAEPSRSSAESPTPRPTGDTGGGDRDAKPPADVLRFSAPRLGGGTIDGEDLAGRDVAFWFWAPW